MDLAHSLIIRNLHVSIDDKEILKGVSFTVDRRQVHVVMGPNGSGKSTLAYAIMGHPNYKCPMSNVKCPVKLGDKNITNLSTEERAKMGLFLAFQSPIPIPGVSVSNLLRSAYQTIYGTTKTNGQMIQNPLLARRWNAGNLTLGDFTKRLKEYASLLHIDESFLHRGIHDGFSGGEKKKIEILQALVLAPKFVIFDEIDTGLDVDALRIVAKGIERLKKLGAGIVIITHYQRILKYIRPDVIHVLVSGRIVEEGSARLAQKIEKHGYSNYETTKID